MTTKDIFKKQKNGTYAFRANIGFDSKTGKRVQRRGSGYRTKIEAKEAYRKMMADGLDKSAELSQMTFERFVNDIFKPWYKTQVRPQTYKHRSGIINKQLSYFSNYLVDQIKPLDIQKWQIILLKGHSPSSARAINLMLANILERAKTLGIVETNQARVIGYIKKQQSEIDFWTKEEFQKVIDHTDKAGTYTQHFEFMVLWFLFMTGLRSGESRALLWDDIDFVHGTVDINKTLIFYNANDYYFSTPKTQAGKRVIVLDAQTKEFLLEWYEDQKLMTSSKFVFSLDGVPTPTMTYTRIVTAYAEIAGVHRITVHALRHSHASVLIDMGENSLAIKERLGHADIKTTLGIYGHLYPKSNLEVASRLNGQIKAPQ
ncbi:site-specific integrase [Pediococcus parvulus]|uniref:site-specific integrase n=1 Tax=Pediococcus parvulus TaxID=54062 RepID=UPI00070C5B20|nr:site-specific integrase [Pediococcus parvulus]MCT3027377.1 site-specific integrase [Pediococcus parvulus]GEL89267.1 site-specific integrase [Pediococcus parvulus]GHC07178.1 site-specific integrase [Pediococcus parvulus]